MKKLTDDRLFELKNGSMTENLLLPEEVSSMIEELIKLRKGNLIARGYQINMLQNRLNSERKHRSYNQKRLLVFQKALEVSVPSIVHSVAAASSRLSLETGDSEFDKISERFAEYKSKAKNKSAVA